MTYLLGVIIPFINYLFEVYPRFFNKYFGVDVWTRMMEAELIRKNNHRIPKEIIKNGFILEGYLNYPPALPWLLSFIPPKKLHPLQGFIAPVFDCLLNYTVFLLIYSLTGSLLAAVIGQLVYLSTPLAILENSYLTARAFGYLLFTLSFFPLVVYSLNPNPLYLIVSILFTTLLLFTHKFATQSLFFMTLFFTFFDLKIHYIGIFLISVLVALIISRGFYLKILQGHIANIVYWAKYSKYRFAHQVRGLKQSKQKKDLTEWIYFLLKTFTPITLVGTNLWLVMPLLYFLGILFDISFISYDPLLLKLSIWVVAAYVFAVLVMSTRLFLPIGEGQRYLEMAFAPTAIIGAILFENLIKTPYSLWIILLYFGIFIINLILTFFLQWKGIIADKNRSVTQDMETVFAFLKSLKFKKRIICLPHQITTMVLYNTRSDVLVEIETGHLERIPDVFPVLTKSIKEIARKYNLNILLLKKSYADMKELKLAKKDLLFETEQTQVFKL